MINTKFRMITVEGTQVQELNKRRIRKYSGHDFKSWVG